MAKSKQTETLSVLELQQGVIQFNVLGTSPLFYHRFAMKAWHELLLPSGRKTAADRAGSLKHNPLEEYRGSLYRHGTGHNGATRLYFPGSAFGKAIRSAALDLPGVNKSQIGRLSWVEEYNVDIWGIPTLSMMMVRNSDMARTPDVRTRATLPQWACTITVRYARPLLNDKQIGNLTAAAGQIIGIGDGRAEKRTFRFGSFELVSERDKRFLSVKKTAGRAAQDKAIAEPSFFDDESAELFRWFYTEIERRTGQQSAPKKLKTKADKHMAKMNGEDAHAA